MAQTPTVILLDISGQNDGHRAEYFGLLERLLGGERRRFSWAALLARPPVLVTMIEESLSLYVITCLVRSLTGRRTAGLLFRPLPATLGTSVRLVFKRLLLRLVKALPGAATLTIMPFSVEPRFATIAKGWIHDPQFWDLFYPDAPDHDHAGAALAQDIVQQAQGRQVCCAVGRQDVDKGFDLFASAYARIPDLRARFLFAFGGKVRGDVAEQAAAFVQAGGYACDRFITHEELLDLYACADLVWCCYAEAYDQASGVFGRAIQLGLPVVVRQGSLIHTFCLAEGLACVAIGGMADAARLVVPPRSDAATARRGAIERGRVAHANLRLHLGLV